MKDNEVPQELELYLVREWPIFPVHWLTEEGKCSCGDPECQRPGKHPLTGHGFKEASYSREQILQWLKRWPACRWGLRMGSRKSGGSGNFALDIDPDGYGSWELMIDEYQNGAFDTVRTRTPRKGEHYIFLQDDNRDIPCSYSKFAIGIDVRGDGGYIIVPPSDGYQFLLSPEDYNVIPAPQWILDRIEALKTSKTPAPQVEGKISSGTRNSTLASIAGTMRRRGLSQQAIEAALLEENALRCDPPLQETEVLGIAKSIARYEPEDPVTAKPASPEEPPPQFHRTDIGNAERLIHQFGNLIRYNDETSRWFIWDGKRWKPDALLDIEVKAIATVRDIYKDAAQAKDADTRKEIAKWGIRSETRARISAMIDMARSFVPILMEDLDTDPMLVNLGNGTFNFSTGELQPHRQEDRITKLIDINYDPEAKCPKWMEFLNLITAKNEALKKFIQVAAGYSLTGRTDEHVFFTLHGEGNNGKTTLTETLRRVGADYAHRTNVESLMLHHRAGTGPSPYIAGLAGKRFVVGSEIQKDKRLNEALVRDLTGGDTLTADFKHQNPFTFRATHKIWLFGNHLPKITDTTVGMWRRVRIIPFLVTIPPEIDKPMEIVMNEFEAEREGILAWLIEGGLKWVKHGLPSVDLINEATDHYKQEQDIFEQFLDECCERHPDFSIDRNELFKAMRDWANENNENYLIRQSKTWLTYQLKPKGILLDKGRRNYRGIRTKVPF